MQSKHIHLLNELLNLLEPQEKKKKKNDFVNLSSHDHLHVSIGQLTAIHP